MAKVQTIVVEGVDVRYKFVKGEEYGSPEQVRQTEQATREVARVACCCMRMCRFGGFWVYIGGIVNRVGFVETS